MNEELTGIFFGTVIKVEDEDTRRVKIRVFGVFNEPISINEIPWAMPIMDEGVPILGDLVGIIFIEADLQRPMYFPSAKLEFIQNTAKKNLYQTIINTKKASVKTNVVASDKTFSEPVTQATSSMGYAKYVKLLPQDIAVTVGEGVNRGEPSTGLLIEHDMTKGKERYGIFHPSGSFIEMCADGSIVFHSVKDTYFISDGGENSVIEGMVIKKSLTDMILAAKNHVVLDSEIISLEAKYLFLKGIIVGSPQFSIGASGAFSTTDGRIVEVQMGLITKM